VNAFALLEAFLAILTIGCFAYTHIRSEQLRPGFADEKHIPLRTFSRKDLMLVTAGGRFTLFVLITMTLIVLFLAMHVEGRMSVGETVGSSLFVTAFMAPFAVNIFRNCILPLFPVLHGREPRVLLSHVRFGFIRGFWQYIDNDWFIRAGADTSCALYAPDIDFSTPARGIHMYYLGWSTRFLVSFPTHGTRFMKTGMGFLTVNTELDEDLEKWIADHGGTVHKKNK